MGRGERAGVAVPALAAGLLLIAAVATHASGGVRGDGPSYGTAVALVDLEAAVFTVLLVVGAVMFVYAGTRRARTAVTSLDRRKRAQPWMVLPPLAIALVVFVVMAFLRHGVTPQPVDIVGPATGGGVVSSRPGRPVEPSSWAFGIGAAIAILLVVWLFRVARSQPDAPEADPACFGGDGEPMVTLSDDELAAIADPRETVLAAYGQLDALLAPLGLRRRRWEAALEHVDRIRAPLGSLWPHARDLARLFERARYSEAPVSPAAAEQARGALTTLRGLCAEVPA